LVQSIFFLVAGFAERRSIQGKILYKDGQPVPNVWVFLQRVEEANVTHSGFTSADGSFTLNLDTKQHVEPGDYRVVLSPKVAEEDKDLPEYSTTEAEQEAIRARIVAEKYKVVPQKHMDSKTTDLTLTIKQDKTFYLIEIDRPN
jgi:hypothetical protein